MDTIHDSSIAVMDEGWRRLTVDEMAWSAELVSELGGLHRVADAKNPCSE